MSSSNAHMLNIMYSHFICACINHYTPSNQYTKPPKNAKNNALYARRLILSKRLRWSFHSKYPV